MMDSGLLVKKKAKRLEGSGGVSTFLAHHSPVLAESTCQKLKTFDNLRKEQGDFASTVFWDAVVLSACDEQQAASYRLVLEQKVADKELPACAQYLVYADPPGHKVGNGGATMHVLQGLNNDYGAEWKQWRILLIHAGGYSQRLPFVSVIGKVFMRFPLGDPCFSALELKLATYINIPGQMDPGVYICSADSIELYAEDCNLSFRGRGIVALGHPSPIDIGTTHGVFVLAEDDAMRCKQLDFHTEGDHVDGSSSPYCVLSECSHFLHKPSAQLMRKSGAVIADTDVVYTDSGFYCATYTCEVLLRFYEENQPLTCEIDAYGDFLQALGPLATDSYCDNVANVVRVDDALSATRKALFGKLRDAAIPFHVILCTMSKFYHVGTQEEYLSHFCQDDKLRKEIGLEYISDCTGCREFKSEAPRTTPMREREENGDTPCLQAQTPSQQLDVVVMSSFIGEDVTIGPCTVVEHSNLPKGVHIGENSIISCCDLGMSPRVRISHHIRTPDNILMHTVAIDADLYATIFVGSDESFKQKAAVTDAPHDLMFCGRPLTDTLTAFALTSESLWGGHTNPDEKKTLWDARLFSLHDSPRDSFWSACDAIRKIRSTNALSTHSPAATSSDQLQERLSMRMVLSRKNIQRCIALSKANREPASALL